MKKKLLRKLTLSRESLRRLNREDLETVAGAGPTANPTCVGPTCLDSCATCPLTCATCAGGTACGP